MKKTLGNELLCLFGKLYAHAVVGIQHDEFETGHEYVEYTNKCTGRDYDTQGVLTPHIFTVIKVPTVLDSQLGRANGAESKANPKDDIKLHDSRVGANTEPFNLLGVSMDVAS